MLSTDVPSLIFVFRMVTSVLIVQQFQIADSGKQDQINVRKEQLKSVIRKYFFVNWDSITSLRIGTANKTSVGVTIVSTIPSKAAPEVTHWRFLHHINHRFLQIDNKKVIVSFSSHMARSGKTNSPLPRFVGKSDERSFLAFHYTGDTHFKQRCRVQTIDKGRNYQHALRMSVNMPTRARYGLEHGDLLCCTSSCFFCVRSQRVPNRFFLL